MATHLLRLRSWRRRASPAVVVAALLLAAAAVSSGPTAGAAVPPGVGTLIVGVPGEDLAAVDAGAVQAVSLAGDQQTLTQTASDFAAGSTAPGATGTSVVVGDFDGDGLADLATGAPAEEAVRVVPGSSSGGFDTTATVRFSQDGPIPGATEPGDAFGASLAVGDFNGDGYDDLAVGVPLEDLGAIADAGAVTVLYGSAGGLQAAGSDAFTQSGPIAGGPGAGDRFGWALAAGDFDADGYDDLAVGVPLEDLGVVPDAGMVNVVFGSASGIVEGPAYLTQRAPRSLPTSLRGRPEVGDRVGETLAAGDFNGDGFVDLAIGAPREDVGSAVDAGAVNIATGGAGGLTGTSIVLAQAGPVPGVSEAGDRFGAALAVADFDADGRADLAVGAPGEDIGALTDAGAVSVVPGAAGGPDAASSAGYTQSGSIAGVPEVDDAFGAALAGGDLDGDGVDDLAIGVPGEGIGAAAGAGATHVLFGSPGTGIVRAGNTVLRQGAPALGAPEAGDGFGAALAIVADDGLDDADLSITIVDDADPADAGDTLTYTIEVANAGPDPAVGVVVADTLPAGVSLSATSGCLEDPAGVPVCSLGTLAAGASTELTVSVDVGGATSGVITNTVTVTSSTRDPAPGDNTASEDTEAVISGIALTKTDSADPVSAGDSLTYTLTVDNGSAVTAEDVVVTDTLPAGVTLVSTSGCAEDPLAVPTCSLGSIASGGSVSYTVQVTVNNAATGTITNSASVTSTAGSDNTNELTAIAISPLAVDDGPTAASVPGDPFHTGVGATLAVANGGPGDLDANDSFGTPVASVVSFGGGDLGGAVTDRAAGTTATAGGRSLRVNSDGSFTFTPAPGFAGTFTFRYRLANAGGTSDATVSIAVGERPDAFNDGYASAGNVGITVPVGSGVLTNDDGDGLSAVGPSVSAMGGQVSMAADGSFTYDPPPGFTGSDSFQYTLQSGLGSDVATVQLSVSERYWFIDNTAAAGGNGTLATPFTSLAAFDSVNGNGGATDPRVGDVVVVATGAGSYTGGVTLENSQVLVGQGSTVPVAAAAGRTLPQHSRPLPATGGTRPVLSHSGAVVQLATNNVVRGLSLAGSGSSPALLGSGYGSITIADTSISATAGPALDLDTGTVLGSVDGVTVTGSASGGIRLANVSSGSSLTLSGLSLTTTGGTALSASGLGEIAVTGTNTIAATNGPGVSVVGTDIGAAGAVFASVSVSGGANAVTLTDTAGGSFAVNGGTVSGIVGDAVILRNTSNPVTLANMTFTGIGDMSGGFNTRSGHDAIHGENVSGGLTVSNVTADNLSDNFINGSTISDGSATTFAGLTVSDSTISDTNRFHESAVADGVDEGAIRVVGLSGTVAISANDFDRSAEFIDIFSASSGTLDLTITGNTFTDGYREFASGGTAALGRMCIDVTLRGSLTSTVTIGGAGASGNTFVNCNVASVRVATESAGVTGGAQVEVTGNDFRVTDHSSTQGLSGNFPQGGVLLRHRGSGAFDAVVEGNDFGAWSGSATQDWVMNADGAAAALAVLAEGGTTQVEVATNEFNSPINAPFFVRSSGASTAARVHLHDNVYRAQFADFSPDPFFGSFTAPGVQHQITAQSLSTLDLVMVNENLSVHDDSFDNQDTLALRASSSAVACGSFTGVTTDLAGANGDILLSSSTATLNHHDGGGNDPFEVVGTVGVVASCQLPAGPLF